MPEPEHARRGGESPREKVAATVALLEQGIDALLASENFAGYLQTMARFHAYSFRNVALIHAPFPEATRVAGYKTWKQLGRQVRKGEQGIRILVPHKRKIVDEEREDTIEVVRSYGLGTVFDISQTEGASLPEPPKAEVIAGASDVGMRLFVDLIDYLEQEGVSFGRERLPTAYGSYEPRRRRVTLASDVDADQATKTLAHETAHYVAGHVSGMDEQDIETVAESSAFVIPLRHWQGTRTYLMLHPYTPEPGMMLTVALSPQQHADGAVGHVVSSRQRGVRQRQRGIAQAWHYPADRLAVLWECYFFEQFRAPSLPNDATMHSLWTSVEHALVEPFSNTNQIVTPFDDPEFEQDDYQALVRSLGYQPVAKAVFGKEVNTQCDTDSGQYPLHSVVHVWTILRSCLGISCPANTSGNSLPIPFLGTLSSSCSPLTTRCRSGHS